MEMQNWGGAQWALIVFFAVKFGAQTALILFAGFNEYWPYSLGKYIGTLFNYSIILIILYHGGFFA